MQQKYGARHIPANTEKGWNKNLETHKINMKYKHYKYQNTNKSNKKELCQATRGTRPEGWIIKKWRREEGEDEDIFYNILLDYSQVFKEDIMGNV